MLHTSQGEGNSITRTLANGVVQLAQAVIPPALARLASILHAKEIAELLRSTFFDPRFRREVTAEELLAIQRGAAEQTTPDLVTATEPSKSTTLRLKHPSDDDTPRRRAA